MKELYLFKNQYTNQYVFYEGKNEHNRTEIPISKGLEKALENVNIDPKRKAVLYVDDLSDEEVSQIEKYFKKTKIDIKRS